MIFYIEFVFTFDISICTSILRWGLRSTSEENVKDNNIKTPIKNKYLVFPGKDKQRGWIHNEVQKHN